MPIHRLNESPERNATLVDITCDSDGKINKFIDLQDVKDTLPLHALDPGEPYYLGLFLVGAYQDIMGDLHNLFGRVTEVHVFLDEDEDSGYYIEEIIEGSTIARRARADAMADGRTGAADEGADRRRHQERPAQAQRGDANAGDVRKGSPGLHVPDVQRDEVSSATREINDGPGFFDPPGHEALVGSPAAGVVPKVGLPLRGNPNVAGEAHRAHNGHPSQSWIASERQPYLEGCA